MAAAGNVINASVLPRLNQAVRAVVAATQTDWMTAVQHARLWSGEKDAYSTSIQAKMTGDFSGLVWTDYKYAEEIDNGRPAKDLKSMLDTSLKVRTSKKGKRYLIIPFRHNTPGNDALAPAMPSSIDALASQLTPSRVTGMGTRVSGTGAMNPKTRLAVTVPQRRYSWGERLVGASLAGGDKRHEGMYRFDVRTPGGRRESEYLTFRVMMEGSPGWVVAPKPGLNIARGVVERMQPLAELAFGEAVKVA